MKKLTFGIITAFLAIFMPACSSDDNGGDEPSAPVKKMVLTEMIGGYTTISSQEDTGFQAKYVKMGILPK